MSDEVGSRCRVSGSEDPNLELLQMPGAGTELPSGPHDLSTEFDTTHKEQCAWGKEKNYAEQDFLSLNWQI